MLKFFRNRKGQNTAEYALLIGLVTAGAIAMTQYTQRALQAKARDTALYMTSQPIDANATNGSLTTAQYEPYYMQSNYEITRNAEDSKRLDTNVVSTNAISKRTRTGSSTTTYGTFNGI